MPSPKFRRYLPPTRTSISQASSVIPIDFGTHHCLNSSGFDHASNTRRAGASKVRVVTSSRSDLRSIFTGFFTGLLSFLASIDLLLSFQFFDDLVQRVEPFGPELAVLFEPPGR